MPRKPHVLQKRDNLASYYFDQKLPLGFFVNNGGGLMGPPGPPGPPGNPVIVGGSGSGSGDAVARGAIPGPRGPPGPPGPPGAGNAIAVSSKYLNRSSRVKNSESLNEFDAYSLEYCRYFLRHSGEQVPVNGPAFETGLSPRCSSPKLLSNMTCLLTQLLSEYS